MRYGARHRGPQTLWTPCNDVNSCAPWRWDGRTAAWRPLTRAGAVCAPLRGAQLGAARGKAMLHFRCFSRWTDVLPMKTINARLCAGARQPVVLWLPSRPPAHGGFFPAGDDPSVSGGSNSPTPGTIVALYDSYMLGMRLARPAAAAALPLGRARSARSPVALQPRVQHSAPSLVPAFSPIKL